MVFILVQSLTHSNTLTSCVSLMQKQGNACKYMWVLRRQWVVMCLWAWSCRLLLQSDAPFVVLFVKTSQLWTKTSTMLTITLNLCVSFVRHIVFFLIALRLLIGPVLVECVPFVMSQRTRKTDNQLESIEVFGWWIISRRMNRMRENKDLKMGLMWGP